MQILVVVFGQELPDATANLVDQVFSLAVALIGLGTFALVLALVEQVVLEVSVHDCLKAFISKLTFQEGHLDEAGASMYVDCQQHQRSPKVNSDNQWAPCLMRSSVQQVWIQLAFLFCTFRHLNLVLGCRIWRAMSGQVARSSRKGM